MCDSYSIINPQVLCVSASRDDTDAHRSDCLRSGRYKMVSEHTLTVGHDFACKVLGTLFIRAVSLKKYFDRH